MRFHPTPARDHGSNEAFWRKQEPILSKAMLSGRYPALAGLDEDAFADGDTPVFELGLAALLDGFEELIAARTRPNG